MRHWLPCLAVATGLLGLALTPVLAAESPQTVVLSGSITDTTNPAKPATAEVLITFTAGKGVLRIGAPLYGSGACTVQAHGEGQLVLRSDGPLRRIIWTGSGDGSAINGTYEAENLVQPSLPERGTFALKFGTGEALAFTDVIGGGRYPFDGKDYMVLTERDVLSLHQTTGEYMGFRMVLDDKQEPVVVIHDFDDGSRFIDPSTNTVIGEWIPSGNGGHYAMPKGDVTEFFDRFLDRLPWTKVTPKEGNAFFVRDESGVLELFDKDLKPLNIRSGKTDTGRMFWTKTDENVTSFYDEQLQPLNWHEIQTERGLFYATPHPKKAGQYRFFDSNMKELKKPSFWRQLAYGLAVGMMAYGHALQESSRYTTTTATTFGNTTYYRTREVGGSSTVTSHRFGNMEFVHGRSRDGGRVSGSVNHIGATSFLHLRTAAGAWRGSTQRVGNFAFHNLRGPQGQSLRGSSHRVGNWIFTTVR